ncbi:MAG: Re/Si-specific NAD(P)(+) transhydrogenase subunit alpha [Candidatus Xenobia bacterium]
MEIGVPREIVPNERRVALIPEEVGKAVKAGFKVVVQKGAGSASNYTDEQYEKAGATLTEDVTQVLKADIVTKVARPETSEVEKLKEGAVYISFFSPLTDHELVRKLVAQKVSSLAMEMVPRITRAQSMDALSSMATVAGYKAVLLGANALTRFFPMFTTAAGTIKPARVLVIGAGVAGLQAIATARRLGAVVEAFDTRPVVKEQVQSLGAKFVELEVSHEAAQDAGGYAKELDAEHIRKEKELIFQHVKDADVVITTAAIPGRPAPKLITEDAVKAMKPGSVIVDLAAETGGNCEITVRGEQVEKHGVIICGLLNLPSMMPYHASAMYSRNVWTLLQLIAPKAELKLNFEDDVIKGTVITHQGEITHAAVKKAVEASSGATASA